MLRMIQNQSAASGKAYFTNSLQKSDYYVSDAELPGLFGGRLATRLGLHGDVTKEAFFALCDNIDPITGNNLTPETREDRTVFYDVNFHVPKSVSICNALTDDDHIVRAFRDSVRATMAEIESDSLTRVRIAGKHEDRKSGELLYAEFIHHTARPVEDHAPDPQLHAHMIIMNCTNDPVEQRIKACQFREIKRNMPYYQVVFYKHMADALQGMGYEIRRTKNSFEIEGVPKEAIDLFSKRKKQIEKVAKEKGITDKKQLAELGARTRAKKTAGMNMADLKANWRKQIIDKNIVPDNDKPIRYGHPTMNELVTPDKCVEHALKHSFERASVKSERKVLADAVFHSIGSRFAKLEDVKQQFYADERFVRIDEDIVTQCTTKAILQEEMNMVGLAQKGIGAVKPLYEKSPELKLDNQQRDAVANILTSYDRVNIIRGAAGAGKTTLMREAVKHINTAGKQVFTVAPTSEASRGVLKDEGFKTATTVASLLGNTKEHTKLRGHVIWVDEAGLLGNKEMTGLLELANQYDARLILGGDTRQHSSVVRGDALRVLNKVGNIPVAEVNKIYRQKSHEYRTAIEQISKGNMEDGFKKLDAIGSIRSIDKDEPYRQLISDYITSVKAKKSALVISPTHAQGEEITKKIREVLRSERMIGKQELIIEKLTSLNLTEAEKADWRNFNPGQTVQFNQNAKGIKRGSVWTVKGVSEQYISLSDKSGATRSLPLDKPLTYDLFEKRKMAISKGDKIKITRNGLAERKQTPRLDDYLTLYSKKQQIAALKRQIKKNASGRGDKKRTVAQRKRQAASNYKKLAKLEKAADKRIQISNGQLLEVASINKQGKIELQTTDGKARYLLDKDYGHLTHAHCLTSHAAQGKTVDRCFVYQPETTFEATTDKQFYVSASRARERVVFYTDDKKGLLEHVSKLSDRKSALELVSKHKDHMELMQHIEHAPLQPNKAKDKVIDKDIKPARFEDRDYEPRL